MSTPGPADELGLSPANAAFRRHVDAHPELLKRSTFAGLDQYVPIVGTVQCWPTFVSTTRANELHDVVLAVSDGVRGYFQHELGYDPTRVESALGYDTARARDPSCGYPPTEDVCSALELTGAADVAVRGDVVITPSAPQVVELNVGGALGGWQGSFITPVVEAIPEIASFLETLGGRAKYLSALDTFFDYIVRSLPPSTLSEQCDVGVYCDVDLPEGELQMRAHFMSMHLQRALERAGLQISGSAKPTTPDDIAEDDEGRWRIEATTRAVVDAHAGPSHERYRKLALSAYRHGHCKVVMGPMLGAALSDKRMLAHLSARAEDELGWADRDVIRRVLPWSRIVAAGETTYQGEEVALLDLLANREDFLLKKGLSFGGKDVVLGIETPRTVWDEAVRRAVEDGEWIVQRFTPSIASDYQVGEEGRGPCHTVLGVFSFERRYSGMYIRLTPVHGSAIVNVSRGASNGVVYEIDGET